MSVLRSFERRLRDRIEGLFARGPAGVQPVELGEWLTEEMDEQRMVGREKVYAPAEFTVYLGPDDTKGLAPYLDTLAGELSQLLFEHARERNYSVAHVPQVRFAQRESLPEGEVDIETRLAEPAESSGTTQVFSPEQLAELRKAATVAAVELPDGTVRPLTGERLVIGRLATSDIVLDDANVSRTNSELAYADGGWIIKDLGSTNGTRVNGEHVQERALADGDRIEVGATALTFRVG